MAFTAEAFAEFLLGSEGAHIVTKRRVPRQVESIDPDHALPAEDDLPIKAGEGYFRIWMVSMFIKHERSFFRNRFAATTSDISFEFGDQKLDIVRVVSPASMLSVNAGDTGVVEVSNRPLTPLVPYNGGSIDLKVGLVSMKGNDMLAQFTSAMEDVTEHVAVSELSTVLNSLDVINSAVGKLLDVDRDVMKIAYAETFTSSENELVPGYSVIINHPDDTIDPEHLWIKDDVLMLGSFGHEGAVPFRDADYLILRVETLAERDDWRALKTVSEPYQEAIKAIGKTKKDSDDTCVADGMIRTAILNAYTAPDLSRIQREKVCIEIHDEYVKAKGLLDKLLHPLADGNQVLVYLDHEATRVRHATLFKSHGMSESRPTLRDLLDVD